MRQRRRAASRLFAESEPYRITVRDQAGTIFSRERRAASLFLSAQGLEEQSEIVKIERIDRSTGEVLGGLYLE
jgi:hypothetical protein